MRILQVNTFADKVGGAEVYMHHLMEELDRRGHQVGLFATRVEGAERSPLRCIVERPEWSGDRLIQDAELIEAWTEFTREFRPDLIHCHNLHTFPVEFLAAAAAVGCPIIMMVHDMGLFCPNSWLTWADGTVCAGGAGAKCFEHDCGANYPFDGRVVLSTKLRTEAIARHIDAFTAPSQCVADKLIENGFRRTHVVPYWVPDPPPGPAPTPPERERQRVLFVGRLVREKGVDFLVRAWPKVLERCPDATLQIVGDGPEREQLEALASELGLDAGAIFLGRVPHAEVNAILETATCQVLPSIWVENSPLTTYESYLAGLPMIASDIGGLPEMVREGETGLIAKPRDAHSLAARLIELLTDPELQRRLQQGCRDSVPRFSRDVHMARLQPIYDDLIANADRYRSERGETDPDLVAATHSLFAKFSEVERWAIDMKRHIDYLEDTGEAGKPVEKFARHVKYLIKRRRSQA